MTRQGAASLLSLSLSLSLCGLAVAQTVVYQAPTFTVSPDSSDNNATNNGQPVTTSNPCASTTCTVTDASVNVGFSNFDSAIGSCAPLGSDTSCHIETCVGQGLNSNGEVECKFKDWIEAKRKLGVSNTYTFYGEYRVKFDGVAAKSYSSPSAAFTLTLDRMDPVVDQNFPSGLTLDNGAGPQTQSINGVEPQWITWFDYSPATPNPQTVTIKARACPASGTCDLLTPSALSPPPYSWDWPGFTTFPSTTYTYVKIGATDALGNSAYANPAATQIGYYNPASAVAAVTCSPNGSSTGGETCGTLADQDPLEIMDDSPSTLDSADTTSACGSGNALSGYSDPSMRADFLPTTSNANGPPNFWGTNLYMLYSAGNCYPVTLETGTSHLPYFEAHLAYSANTEIDERDAVGVNWQTWCSPFTYDCNSNTTPGATPIFPSKYFLDPNDTTDLRYSYVSSHEVPNFWSYVDPTGETESWYAVHLMYFVVADDPSIRDSISGGCLVVTAGYQPEGNTQPISASTPGDLSWAGNSTQPGSCSQGIPAGSVALKTVTTGGETVDTLWNLISGTAGAPSVECSSWGEPAIMVRYEAAASGPVAYLATSCFDSGFISQGYWVFRATGAGGTAIGSDPTAWTWAKYGGPFGLSSLTTCPSSNEACTPIYTNPSANTLSKFDWALRSDGTSLVAIATPEDVSGGVYDYGCLALDFTLPSTGPATGDSVTFPFTRLLATVKDADALTTNPGGSEEYNGPGACAYEPSSNNGVVIVRHLTLQNLTSGVYDVYSIINSGVTP